MDLEKIIDVAKILSRLMLLLSFYLKLGLIILILYPISRIIINLFFKENKPIYKTTIKIIIKYT